MADEEDEITSGLKELEAPEKKFPELESAKGVLTLRFIGTGSGRNVNSACCCSCVFLLYGKLPEDKERADAKGVLGGAGTFETLAFPLLLNPGDEALGGTGDFPGDIKFFCGSGKFSKEWADRISLFLGAAAGVGETDLDAAAGALETAAFPPLLEDPGNTELGDTKGFRGDAKFPRSGLMVACGKLPDDEERALCKEIEGGTDLARVTAGLADSAELAFSGFAGFAGSALSFSSDNTLSPCAELGGKLPKDKERADCKGVLGGAGTGEASFADSTDGKLGRLTSTLLLRTGIFEGLEEKKLPLSPENAEWL